MTTPNSLDDVIAIVEGCFDGHTFTMPADAFGPGEIQNLIGIYMEGDQIVLDAATYSTMPNYIAVSGAGNNQPFGTTSVNVAFGFDASKGGATMNLVASPQTGWTFAVSFPTLSTTFLPELTFDFGKNVDMHRGFYLASYDSAAIADVPATQYGLYFRANLQLTGLLLQLNWLLGGTSSVLVQGPINMHQGIPEMDLKAPTILGDFALGYFVCPGVNFDITTDLVPSNQNGVQSASASALMSFSTIVRFQTDQTRVDIPVSAAFLNRPTFLQFSANLTNAVYATLNELAVLMAGADLESLLGGINLSDYVQLSNFVLQVNPSTQELMSVSMGVRTAQPLTLIADGGYGNVLTINSIKLAFRALPPFTNPSLNMAVLGEVQIFDNATLNMSAVYPNFVFDAQLQQGTNLNLVQVVQYFIQSIAPDALADVPAINVTQFGLTVQPSANSYRGVAAIDNDWPITLGPTTLLIKNVLFSINYDNGTVESQIAGEVIIGDNLANIKVDWQLPGDLTIQGVIPSIDLTDLINTYTSVPLLFTLPAIVLTNTNLLIQRFQNGGYFLAFGTTASSPNFGTLELEFAQITNQTGFTIGFALPPGWKLTDLSSDFDVWLLQDLTFTQASLIISSFNNPNFQFRAIQDHTQPPSQQNSRTIMPQYANNGIQAGMYLYADLTLDPTADNAFGTVSKLLAGNSSEDLDGLNSLKVALSIPEDYTKTSFMATLNGAFNFIEFDGAPIVVLNELGMQVRPFDEYIQLYMAVTINVQGARLGLIGSVEIDGFEVDLRLATTTPWINPFGIRGLTINNMAAEFRFGDTIALGLEGSVTLGTGTSAIQMIAAMEFNIEADFAPDVFFISVSGSINFGAIIGSFVASKYVPSVLNNIILYQFSFIIIANPAGWTDLVSGQSFGMGIGFSGTISIYGLVAKVAVQVDYVNGIFANAQLDGPLRIGPTTNGVPAVTIANAVHWDQGPYITINSASSPYVNMSVALRIWEISVIQLQATVSDGGFYLSFNFTLTVVPRFGQMAITAYIQNRTAFQFAASLIIQVGPIGPIKVGRKNLGTIPSISIAASFQLNIGPNVHIALSLGAVFSISNYRMTLPTTAIDLSSTTLTSFSQIPGIFSTTLANTLWDIGAVLFQNANALFQYAKQGFLALTDDIGNIMNNYLRLSIKDAAVYLRSVMSVMDYDIEDVARLLKSGFNAADKDLTIALKYANFLVEDIASVVSKLYSKTAEQVAQVLKDAGYELGEIATALKNAFRYSAKEVATFFKKAWNISDKVVNAALKTANYVASAIEDAMKDVYGWLKSAAQAVNNFFSSW